MPRHQRQACFQFAFIITLSVAVSVLLEAAGVLLVSSMMIIPVAAVDEGRMVVITSTQIIGILFSELSVFLGLMDRLLVSIPSGAAIVSVNIIILVLVADDSAYLDAQTRQIESLERIVIDKVKESAPEKGLRTLFD
ncbi:MAG: metal ABC transporter permease [Bacillus subtilis]|nr:metal ABC transporter permease [Bacillus subtilis]